MSVMAGHEFLGQALSNIQNRYLKFYSDPFNSYWVHKLKDTRRFK